MLAVHCTRTGQLPGRVRYALYAVDRVSVTSDEFGVRRYLDKRGPLVHECRIQRNT